MLPPKIWNWVSLDKKDKSRVGAGNIPEELGSLVIPESEDVLKNKTRNHNGEEHVKRTEVPTE